MICSVAAGFSALGAGIAAALTDIAPLALVAGVAGFAAAIVAAVFLGLFASLFGSSLTDPSPAVNLLSTVIQGACLILAAYLFARLAGHSRPWDFGLRPTRKIGRAHV